MSQSGTGHAPSRGVSYLYMAAAFVVVVAGMRAAEAIVNPLLLAVFLAVISAPGYFGLLRRGFSNWLALLIVIGALSFVVVGVVLVVMESIAGFTSNQEHYKERLTVESKKLKAHVEAWTPEWIGLTTTDSTEESDEKAYSDSSSDGPSAINSDDDTEADDTEADDGNSHESLSERSDQSAGSTASANPPDMQNEEAADDETNDATTDVTSTNSLEETHAVSPPLTGDGPTAISFGTPRTQLPQNEQSWREYMSEQFNPFTAISLAAGVAGSIGQLLSNAFLILLAVIFILLETGTFTRKMSEAFSHSDSAGDRARQIITSIQRYIVIKTWMSLGTGVIIALWLKFLGVPYANLWGLLAFLFNFIPNVGSVIAAIPAVLIAWLDLTAMPAVACAIGFLVVNVAIGNFIEPRLMGKGLGLSPLVVFCSMVFWGWVLGPVGMLLSVPLTMTARIAFDGFDDTKWLSILMGNAT